VTLLFRYLFRNNLQVILPTLAVGTGLYLLSDLFDRLDDILEAGVPGNVAIWYFVAKTPLIISQILPAVFLLAALIQLCLMSRDRELMALQAGGVSFGAIARFFVVYGLLWAVLQLGFSQVLGVAGERESARIWQEQVRGRTPGTRDLTNVWFTDDNHVIHLEVVTPALRKGQGFAAYGLAADGIHIDTVIRAKAFTGTAGTWKLQDVEVFSTRDFGHAKLPEMSIAIGQDPQDFAVIDPGADPQRLPLWQLGDAVEKLRTAGSNVEGLRTAWHMKLAYAASLVVMGLLAVAMVTWRDNIYLATGLALVFTFLFYTMFTIGSTLGQKGIVSPPIAAWGADILVGVVASARLLLVLRPRSLR